MVRQGAQLVWCGNAFRNNLNHINDSLYIENILVFNQHIEIEVVFLSFFLSYLPPFFVGRIFQRWLNRLFFKSPWMKGNNISFRIFFTGLKISFRFSVSCPESQKPCLHEISENEKTEHPIFLYRAMLVDVFILFCLILLNIRSLHEVLQQWFLLIFVYFTWNEYITIKFFKIYLYNFK